MLYIVFQRCSIALRHVKNVSVLAPYVPAIECNVSGVLCRAHLAHVVAACHTMHHICNVGFGILL